MFSSRNIEFLWFFTGFLLRAFQDKPKVCKLFFNLQWKWILNRLALLDFSRFYKCLRNDKFKSFYKSSISFLKLQMNVINNNFKTTILDQRLNLCLLVNTNTSRLSIWRSFFKELTIIDIKCPIKRGFYQIKAVPVPKTAMKEFLLQILILKSHLM
jgi:hypothetical protein